MSHFTVRDLPADPADYDPAMVEWFVKMVEERKSQHDSSKEVKNW